MNTIDNLTTNFIQLNPSLYCYYQQQQTVDGLSNFQFITEPKFVNATNLQEYTDTTFAFNKLQYVPTTYYLPNLTTQINSDQLLLPPTVQSNYYVEPQIYDSTVIEPNLTGTSDTSSPQPNYNQNGCTSLQSKYQCEICFKYFSKKYVLKRHLGTHNSLKTFNCSACKIGFYRKDIYDRHLKTKRCLRKHQAITTVKLAIGKACSSFTPLYFNCFKLAPSITTTTIATNATYHNIMNQ